MVVHLLHIRKTGGTVLKHALDTHQLPNGCVVLQHGHENRLRDVPPGHLAIFLLRDTLTRFVSGFYCRQRKGWPRYNPKWTPGESTAITARRLNWPADMPPTPSRPSTWGPGTLCSWKR